MTPREREAMHALHLLRKHKPVEFAEMVQQTPILRNKHVLPEQVKTLTDEIKNCGAMTAREILAAIGRQLI